MPENQDPNANPNPSGGGTGGDAPKPFNQEEVLKEHGGSFEKYHQANTELKKSLEKYADYDKLKENHDKYDKAFKSLTPILGKHKIASMKDLETVLEKAISGQAGDKSAPAGKGEPGKGTKIDWSGLTSKFKVDPEFLDAFLETISPALAGNKGEEWQKEVNERLMDFELKEEWNEFYIKNREALASELKPGKEDELMQTLLGIIKKTPLLLNQAEGNLFSKAYQYFKFESNPENLKKAREAGRKLSEIEEQSIQIMAAATDQGKGGNQKPGATDQENWERKNIWGLPEV